MTQITIDRNFARFAGKSYAINKINSVEVREDEPEGRALFAFGILLAFIGLVNLFPEPSTGTVLLTAVGAGMAYLGWQKKQRRKYHLILMTSSSEVQAFSTYDNDEITALRNSIEEAICQH